MSLIFNGSSVAYFAKPIFYIHSQNELSSPIAANFCPTFFLAKIFIFMLFFYLLVYVN